MLANYQIKHSGTGNNNDPIAEDPLSPIQSQSTELYNDPDIGLDKLNNEAQDFINGDNILNSAIMDDDIDFTAPEFQYSNEEMGDGEDGDGDEDSDISSTSSFELYQGQLVREKVISQLNKEHKDVSSSDFMLKYYKYRELNDMSKGLDNLIQGIDTDLIQLVNDNYLSFIKLGKSIDGSLDLIHDVKIDVSNYLKNLKHNNTLIDKDLNVLDQLNNSRERLIILKIIVKRLITLSEMIECFDKLCSKFDNNEECTDMLKELVGLYFGINDMFYKLLKQIKDKKLESLVNNSIILGLSKKMNGLKLEFKSLLSSYLKYLTTSKTSNNEVFEMFKLYQLLNAGEEFKKSLQ